MQQRENLSAFIDGCEVDDVFLNELSTDPVLKQKWASYHAISAIMHNDEIILGRDFSLKMEALLEDEEIETQSVNTSSNVAKPKGMLLKLKGWSTPIIQAGIAASVCFVAVLGVNMMNSDNDGLQVEQPVLQTLPFSNSIQPVSYNAPEKHVPTAEQLEKQQRKISDLLENGVLEHRTDLGSLSLTEEEKLDASQTSVISNQEK
ncbi:transcriptional regulator [[Haemophilus] ducreyi]|uniref:Anti-sigma-E factor RseA n=3 Tax=Haemophilus ducreyi TaxID=730 RepID=Q7VM36_HAEDU|nr:anti sigma-E factor RseA C-terminal domain-containing protein [[Haemophilus] ducreyi]AAP96027.1 putative sigma-E factor negative regulatory protein [[Haemophilus] ducreyi 35000HP]AKO31017.1 sigma-E factor negative regulatory protein [[Haemophilus] ducreyi]AKO32461.1 sigma-E factor negative regulatory protein [[Haemophilus] ducreyi]AKO33912.1 sigma-E factor negative regulatory protein [[Haemophilus] ducreyi]AKO35359.1 sigma-E factor negative regulatory protein [[Haemophilus] ducreyi]